MVTVTVKLVRLGCWEKGGRKEIKLAFRPSYIPFLTGDCWLAISSRRQLPFWALNHQEKDEKGEKKEMGFGDNITRESGKDEDGVRALPVAACSAPIRRPSSPLPSVHISWNLLFFFFFKGWAHTHTQKKKSHTSAHYQNGVWGTLEHVAVGIDGKIKGVSSMCAVCDFVELLLEKQNKMEHIPPFCGWC